MTNNLKKGKHDTVSFFGHGGKKNKSVRAQPAGPSSAGSASAGGGGPTSALGGGGHASAPGRGGATSAPGGGGATSATGGGGGHASAKVKSLTPPKVSQVFFSLTPIKC